MKAKRLIALALAAVFMLSAAATPVFAAAALPQENAALEQQNDMVSIRLKATGDLVYGSNYKLEVQTNPADTQYIGVVVGVGGEANGYVTLVLSDKIRTLLKMIPLPKKMSKTPDQAEEFNVYSYLKQLIDGYDAASVPDGIVADRLDSAGYSQALSIDKASLEALQGATGANICATKSAVTEENAYKLALQAKRVLGRKGVPKDGRFMIASPEYMEVLMLDSHFIKQGDLSQELVQTGAVGKIAGFAVYESNNMDFENANRVASKKTTTDFICGHPNWCHRVMEWQVPVHLQDLNGSGKYIGASAVQGRKVYGIKVSKPQTLFIKRTEAAT